nr:unnamed protein product [Callosobruchus chinensis]
MEIKKDGDKWSIVTETLFRTTVTEFKLDEEYEEIMPAGNLKVKFAIIHKYLVRVSDITEGR